MMPAILRKAMRLKAPAARVWQYIGTEAGLRQWWGADIALEAKVDL
jgi:uncharacterized protein YndB with AHSA1/START domain